jgi:tetratricopeptide (TPR) repeat protein
VRSLGTGLLLAFSCTLVSGCVTPSFEKQLWYEVKTKHFTLMTDTEPERVLEVARDIELFRSVVLGVTNVAEVDPRVPTLIYLFEDSGSFGYFKPSSSFGIGGYFQSTLMGNYVALNANARDIDPTQILKHEYVHFLLRNSGSLQYPAWYNEGLADFLSTVKVKDERVLLGEAPKIRERSLRSGQRLSIAWVLGADSVWRMSGRQVDMFYAQSWLLTHFLHAGHYQGFENRNDGLHRYLELVNEGYSAEEACTRAFGLDAASLGFEAARYLQKGRLPFLALPVSRFPAYEEPEVRSLAPEEIAFRLGDLSLHLPGGNARAEELFLRALEHDPEHARSQMGLALALGAQQKAGIEAAIERSLVLGPDDPWVQLWAGRFRLWQLAARHEELPEDDLVQLLEDTRAFLERSIALEPEQPAAYAALGETYLYDPGEPAPGIRALETARQIAGPDNEVDLPLAALYIDSGQLPEARELIEGVLHWSHGGRSTVRAQELLQQLEAAEGLDAPADPASWAR